MEKKEKIELGVTIIGIVALIAILAGSFGKKPKKIPFRFLLPRPRRLDPKILPLPPSRRQPRQ